MNKVVPFRTLVDIRKAIDEALKALDKFEASRSREEFKRWLKEYNRKETHNESKKHYG